MTSSLRTPILLLALAACGGAPAPAAAPAAPSPTGPSAPIVALTADGRHLAEGEWLACHADGGVAIELHDREFDYNGGQASVAGTYELVSGKVVLAPSDAQKWAALSGGASTELEAAPDLSSVGGMPCRRVGD